MPSVRSSVPPGSPRATSPPKAAASPAPNGRSRLGPGPPSPTKRTPPSATASPGVRASIGHHRRKSSIDPAASNLNGSAPRTPKAGTPQGLPSTARPLAFKIPKPPAPEPTPTPPPPPPAPRSPSPPRPVESPTNPLADVLPPSSSPLLSEQVSQIFRRAHSTSIECPIASATVRGRASRTPRTSCEDSRSRSQTRRRRPPCSRTRNQTERSRVVRCSPP